MSNVTMKVQILMELAQLEEQLTALDRYIGAVVQPSSHIFLRNRVQEATEIANRIIDLQDAYDNDCTDCIGEAYHRTRFYQQHGQCQGCFHGAVEETPEIEFYVVEFTPKENAYGGCIDSYAKFYELEGVQAFLDEFRDQFTSYEVRKIYK